VYIGSWVIVFPTFDRQQSTLGKLEAVIQTPSSLLVRVAQYVADRGDCAVTKLPIVRRNGTDTFDFSLQRGARVDVICVTYFGQTYRFNDKIKPLTIEL
jgi:hypothetical protein